MDISEEEIKKLLDKVIETASSKNVKVWDKQIFEHLGVISNDKAVTPDEFIKKFQGKLEYGITMLRNASTKRYYYNVNRRYKKSLGDMLEKMGLLYEAKMVRHMSYQEFMEKQIDNKWDYVYEQYGSYHAEEEAEKTSPSKGVKKTLAEKTQLLRDSRELKEILGY